MVLTMPVTHGQSTAQASGSFADVLEQYAQMTHVISAGETYGDRVYIQIGDEIFFDITMKARATRGLYVVAIRDETVLIKEHYDLFSATGASEGMAQDIEELPDGSFVVVAAKDKPIRYLDQRGQDALYSIGGGKKLLGANSRTSYYCIGVKGLPRGQAIEQLAMPEQTYKGPTVGTPLTITFPKQPEPKINTEPGTHREFFVDKTEVIYYIPKYFDPNTAEYLFGIHGAGGSGGAFSRIGQFRRIADIENLVIVAPRFDFIYNFDEKNRRDAEGNVKPNIYRDFYLYKHQQLLYHRNEHRVDLRLIEIFELFNQQLMKREKFHLYGHSGGGQFAHRFAIFHPELINKIAVSSAGSYTFPRRDKAYPYGLDMTRLKNTYGAQTNEEGLKLTNDQLDNKLDKLLDLDMYLIVGELDTDEDTDKGDFWQGKGHVERGRNFWLAMQAEDQRLKDIGIRDASKFFRFKFHVMPGIGHDSNMAAATAVELLFPTPGSKTKPKVFHLAIKSGRIREISGFKNVLSTKKRPRILKDHLEFGHGTKQHIHSELKQASDLTGCTEMTIRVRVRMLPNTRRHYTARIVQTCNNQWGGSVISVHKTNLIHAWLETTSSQSTIARYRRIGRSPTLAARQPIDDGQWHEVILTYTGKEVALYIDGDLQEKVDWHGRLLNMGSINIGYVKSNGFYYDGCIGELEITGTRYNPKEK